MTVKPLTMTKAIILSAGQGRRLLPLTENKPKCLLAIAGRAILQWQLDALLEAGIEEISVITGFRSDLVEQLLRSEYPDITGIEVIYNPFFNVSDNLASCWLARSSMDSDFLLINGDTIFEHSVLNCVLASPSAPIWSAVMSYVAMKIPRVATVEPSSRVKPVARVLAMITAMCLSLAACETMQDTMDSINIFNDDAKASSSTAKLEIPDWLRPRGWHRAPGEPSRSRAPLPC